jgi:hypothetical protein
MNRGTTDHRLEADATLSMLPATVKSFRTRVINRRGCVARDLRLWQGARRKHIRMDLRPTSNAAAELKICNPVRLSNGGPLAALLLSHRTLRLCSFVAPCQRPAITQRTSFYL